jgi:hypothetical protein
MCTVMLLFLNRKDCGGVPHSKLHSFLKNKVYLQARGVEEKVLRLLSQKTK